MHGLSDKQILSEPSTRRARLIVKKDKLEKKREEQHRSEVMKIRSKK